MIVFQGRLSFRQCLSNKPTKYGIKVWCRADPTDGYLHQFHIYMGPVGLTGRQEIGLATRVVMDIASSIKEKHHMNADNYFTSPHLATKLLEAATTTGARLGPIVGTSHPLPSMISCETRGSTAYCGWGDKCVIHQLSTAYQATSIMVRTVLKSPQKSNKTQLVKIKYSFILIF